MMKRFIPLALLAVLTACNARMFDAFDSHQDEDVVEVSYEAADALVAKLSPEAAHDKTILYTSLVDIKDVETSSRFGQMLAEHISSRLAQQDFSVSEARLRDNLKITSKGEFMLSRNVRELAREHEATKVLVGTYAPGKNDVSVNIRLIELGNGSIVASHDFSLPVGPNTRQLLGTEEDSVRPHWMKD